MHSLLARQLKKSGLRPGEVAGPVAELLRVIEAAYEQYDDDRRMLERSLELSSRELLGANADMRALLHSLPDLFVRLDAHDAITDSRGANWHDYFPGQPRLHGLRLQDLLPREVAARVAAGICGVRSDGQRRTVEYELATSTGVEHFEVRFMRVVADEVIGLVRNITAVKLGVARLQATLDAQERRAAQVMRQQAALHELAATEGSEPSLTIGRACSVAAETLGMARASVWFYDPDHTELHCTWLHAHGELQSDPGVVLPRKDCPRYFAALEEQLTLAAADAQHDLRTSEFADTYLAPLGIGAMLDCAVRVGGQTVGVLCLEHVGPPRPWSLEEQDFGAAVASFVALSRSLEQQRQLETQLRHSQKMEAVGMLAGGIAHDFNNLLTAILGFAELLRNNQRLDPLAHAHVTEIVLAGQRASELTSQLLAFGRKQPRAPRLVGVNALVRDVGRMLQRVVGESIAFRVDESELELMVRVDPHQIEQVLLNLVVNARDAMSEQGGILHLRVRRQHALLDGSSGPHPTHSEWAVVEVEDNGVGIPPEHMPRVFEPFFTTKGIGEGTGLGLPMVYGLMQQNGGSVELSSVPGRGTTARVFLPVESIQAPSIEPSPAIMSPDGQLVGGDETVLIVEDEAIVRVLAVELLQRLGYRVLVAARPKDALAILQTDDDVDLLLTDLVMPDMSGAELYRAAVRHRPSLRVMYMSGYAPDRVLRETAMRPGTVFLAKPFTLKQLADKVRDALVAPIPALTAS